MKRPQKKTFHTVYGRNYHEQICKYSIIRFLPYTETGEFANIGIVLYVPALQRLVYKNQTC
jgi:hypothetical protein